MFSRKDGPAGSKLPRRFRAHLGLTIGEAVPPEQVSAVALQARVAALLAENESAERAGKAALGGAA
jgi:hypothetical protein